MCYFMFQNVLEELANCLAVCRISLFLSVFHAKEFALWTRSGTCKHTMYKCKNGGFDLRTRFLKYIYYLLQEQHASVTVYLSKHLITLPYKQDAYTQERPTQSIYPLKPFLERAVTELVWKFPFLGVGYASKYSFAIKTRLTTNQLYTKLQPDFQF